NPAPEDLLGAIPRAATAFGREPRLVVRRPGARYVFVTWAPGLCRRGYVPSEIRTRVVAVKGLFHTPSSSGFFGKVHPSSPQNPRNLLGSRYASVTPLGSLATASSCVLGASCA